MGDVDDDSSFKRTISVMPNYGQSNIDALSHFKLNTCFQVWLIINAISKSSSFITPDISGYICSTTDYKLANSNITNIYGLRRKPGGIAF